jgi:hypothetical protein
MFPSFVMVKLNAVSICGYHSKKTERIPVDHRITPVLFSPAHTDVENAVSKLIDFIAHEALEKPH